MSTDHAELAARLDEVVRGVPGVSALYSATPAIVTSVRQLASGTAPASLISVRSSDDGCAIVASIGVASSVQGPRTAAAVSSAILAALPADLVASVHVRVSRVVL
ncbi:hypothetical protein BH11ACT5_BH11ACT5_10510 [soil metagenome]